MYTVDYSELFCYYVYLGEKEKYYVNSLSQSLKNGTEPFLNAKGI